MLQTTRLGGTAFAAPFFCASSRFVISAAGHLQLAAPSTSCARDSRRYAGATVFLPGNPLIDMASKYAAELQRPTLGLTERRGVEGGSPRLPYASCADGSSLLVCAPWTRQLSDKIEL